MMKKYDFIGNFYEGLAKAIRNDKMGFVDMEGNEIIKCKYDYIGILHEELVVVKLNNKWENI